MTIEIPAAWDDVRHALRPALRTLTEPRGGTDLLARPALPMLHELVVLDLPEARLFVDGSMLEAWGVDAASVWSAARDQLAARATEGLIPRKELGLWQLASGDGHEASRLLLPGWLQAFEGMVPGRPVAVVPAPRVLLVGGEGAPGQIDRLLQLGWDAFRGAAPGISPLPYTVRDGRVVPWTGEGTEHLERAQAARGLLDATVYAAQRDALVGAGAVVAPVRLVREEGRAFTLAPWGPAPGGTLLPVVDVVDVEGVGRVPWARLWATVRGALEEQRFAPVRYLARWPAAGTLKALAG